MNLKRAGKKKC